MKRLIKFPWLIAMLTGIIISGCNQGPKVISESKEAPNSDESSSLYVDHLTDPVAAAPSSSLNEEVHKVIVNEVLPTIRYAYLNVTEEGGNKFWIAIRKQEVTVGDTYYYKGGLLKKNFESKEHDRVFETLYLVTNLVPASHGNTSLQHEKVDVESHGPGQSSQNAPSEKEIIEKKGAIKIADIVKNPKLYEGKSIMVTGKCVKINPNIMNRHWIHLQDGSMDAYDFVVTSNNFVSEGETVTFQAKVGLNKNFGAGYTYDIILENGVLVGN